MKKKIIVSLAFAAAAAFAGELDQAQLRGCTDKRDRKSVV